MISSAFSAVSWSESFLASASNSFMWFSASSFSLSKASFCSFRLTSCSLLCCKLSHSASLAFCKSVTPLCMRVISSCRLDIFFCNSVTADCDCVSSSCVLVNSSCVLVSSSCASLSCVRLYAASLLASFTSNDNCCVFILRELLSSCNCSISTPVSFFIR